MDFVIKTVLFLRKYTIFVYMLGVNVTYIIKYVTYIKYQCNIYHSIGNLNFVLYIGYVIILSSYVMDV